MSFITTLTFVKKQFENDDIYTFYFTPSNKPSHKAGQHGLFLLHGLYRPHPFTLSSSPDEEYVTFTTHTGTGSAFKNRLMQLEEGDKMTMMGPILNFTFIKNVDSYVFLAQGIGVTPFRSMLVYANSVQLPVSTTLIHVDGKGHTFKELTNSLATQAYYPSNPEEFQSYVKKQNVNQKFYISGSPRFVSATKQLLRETNVSPKNIKTDSFLGY
jgi:ferredoxin-NADP reductase